MQQFAPATLVSACESDSSLEVIFPRNKGFELVAYIVLGLRKVDLSPAITLGCIIVALVLGLVNNMHC